MKSKAKPTKHPTPLVRCPAPLRLKRILITTDFSAASKKALPYAAAFAKRFGSKITLLHVLEPPPRFVGLESIVLLQSGDDTMGRLYAGLDALAGKMSGKTGRVDTLVRTGKPYREIISAARESGAGLLVMATHGYTGLKHAFLGSTTERVVRQAPCSVLAVRGVSGRSTGPARPPAIRRILLTTDFSENSEKAFPAALALANSFNAQLTLMHVVDRFPIDVLLGQELTRDTAKQLMAEARVRLDNLANPLTANSGRVPQLVVRFGNPFDEITRGAKEFGASLIVLATHGHTGLKRAYFGSVAERVVRHAQCPVLVVRESMH